MKSQLKSDSVKKGIIYSKFLLKRSTRQSALFPMQASLGTHLFGIPRRQQEERARKVRRFGNTQEEPNDDQVRIVVCECC